MTDGSDVFSPAYLKLTLRGDKGTLSLSERGLGLCHISPGHLTNAKTVLGRLELFAQDLHIVAVDLDQGLVANHVEICHRNRLEYRGLDRQGLRPCRLYSIDRLPGLRHGPAPPVNRLDRLELHE